MTIPAVGVTAPDFTLAYTTGSTITLSSFRGSKHVLIAFFPLAFTSTCTAEVCAFNEDYSQFAAKDVLVLPISVDSVQTLREFKTKHAITVEMASDFKRDTSRAYGVLNDEKFYSNRAYFLVDFAGVIRWTHVESANGEKRENTELLAAIAALAH
ncbi:MAG: redoxin domain-containing protein [Gemmatimonadetes bacterium]|nr:redoxin domain-containing protein [Gemmatimonadota bacterium]